MTESASACKKGFSQDYIAPITGTPPNMRNREYLDAIGQFLEDDVIRKSSDRQSSRAAGHERNPFARGGKSLDVIESFENFGYEPVGNRRVALAIPSRSVAKLLTGGGLDSDAFQR
jgi:hypothetical protein